MGATNPNAGGAPGGGGKGGMNRGPQANNGTAPMPRPSMSAWANMAQTSPSLASSGMPPQMTPPRQMPANFASMMQGRPLQGFGGAHQAPSPQQGILDIRNQMLFGR